LPPWAAGGASLLKFRNRPDEPIGKPLGGMCTIRGGLVHEGAPVVPGEVGTFIAGRPSTAAKMKAARK
jgi:hypothetical protein